MRVFPDTIESFGVTNADVSQLTPREPENSPMFLLPDGTPCSHPNLPAGHGLFCQLDLSDGSTSTYCCNNFAFMRQLHHMCVTGQATDIRWYTGPAYTVVND